MSDDVISSHASSISQAGTAGSIIQAGPRTEASGSTNQSGLQAHSVNHATLTGLKVDGDTNISTKKRLNMASNNNDIQQIVAPPKKQKLARLSFEHTVISSDDTDTSGPATPNIDSDNQASAPSDTKESSKATDEEETAISSIKPRGLPKLRIKSTSTIKVISAKSIDDNASATASTDTTPVSNVGDKCAAEQRVAIKVEKVAEDSTPKSNTSLGSLRRSKRQHAGVRQSSEACDVMSTNGSEECSKNNKCLLVDGKHQAGSNTRRQSIASLQSTDVSTHQPREPTSASKHTPGRSRRNTEENYVELLRSGALGTFQCEFCDRTFRKEKYLERHLVASHPDEALETSFVGDAVVVKQEQLDNIDGTANAGAASATSTKAGASPDTDTSSTNTSVKKEVQSALLDETSAEDSDKDILENDNNQSKKAFRKSKKMKVHECPVKGCVKTFNQKYKVRLHMSIHTDDRPHSCKECAKKFKKIEHLRRHIETYHKPTRCKKCDTTWPSREALREHIRATHNRKLNHTCSICDKTFKELNHLRRHTITHTGERPFKCDICGSSFTQQGTLKEHLISHKGEREFKCDQCEKTYLRKRYLQIHKRTHREVLPYLCEWCQKRFARRDGLTRHLQTHAGIKPFECSRCDKKFPRRYKLVHHLRIAHLLEMVIPDRNSESKEMTLVPIELPPDYKPPVSKKASEEERAKASTEVPSGKVRKAVKRVKREPLTTVDEKSILIDDDAHEDTKIPAEVAFEVDHEKTANHVKESVKSENVEANVSKRKMQDDIDSEAKGDEVKSPKSPKEESDETGEDGYLVSGIELATIRVPGEKVTDGETTEEQTKSIGKVQNLESWLGAEIERLKKEKNYKEQRKNTKARKSKVSPTENIARAPGRTKKVRLLNQQEEIMLRQQSLSVGKVKEEPGASDTEKHECDQIAAAPVTMTTAVTTTGVISEATVASSPAKVSAAISPVRNNPSTIANKLLSLINDANLQKQTILKNPPSNVATSRIGVLPQNRSIQQRVIAPKGAITLTPGVYAHLVDKNGKVYRIQTQNPLVNVAANKQNIATVTKPVQQIMSVPNSSLPASAPGGFSPEALAYIKGLQQKQAAAAAVPTNVPEKVVGVVSVPIEALNQSSSPVRQTATVVSQPSVEAVTAQLLSTITTPHEQAALLQPAPALASQQLTASMQLPSTQASTVQVVPQANVSMQLTPAQDTLVQATQSPSVSLQVKADRAQPIESTLSSIPGDLSQPDVLAAYLLQQSNALSKPTLATSAVPVSTVQYISSVGAVQYNNVSTAGMQATQVVVPKVIGLPVSSNVSQQQHTIMDSVASSSDIAGIHDVSTKQLVNTAVASHTVVHSNAAVADLAMNANNTTATHLSDSTMTNTIVSDNESATTRIVEVAATQSAEQVLTVDNSAASSAQQPAISNTAAKTDSHVQNDVTQQTDDTLVSYIMNTLLH